MQHFQSFRESSIHSGVCDVLLGTNFSSLDRQNDSKLHSISAQTALHTVRKGGTETLALMVIYRYAAIGLVIFLVFI